MQRPDEHRAIASSRACRHGILAFGACRVLARAFTEAHVNSANIFAASFGGVVLLCGSSAMAQGKFSTSSAKTNDWSSPADSSGNTSYQSQANNRHVGLGLSLGALIVGGRWEVANGGLLSVDAVWRKNLDRHNLDRQNRIEVGGIGRFGFTPDAVLIGGGIPFRLVMGIHPQNELAFGLEFSYTRMIFNQPFFVPRNGFTATARIDFGHYFDPRVCVGITPLAFSVITGERVDAFVTYEPGMWVRFSPI